MQLAWMQLASEQRLSLALDSIHRWSQVVTLDDTGTPLRSKAFHSARYGQPDSMSGRLEDHIAAIQQLAAQHPCTPPEVCLGAQPAGKGLVVALDACREHASSPPLCGEICPSETR